MRANLYPPGAFSNYRYMQSAPLAPRKPSKEAPRVTRTTSLHGGFRTVVIMPATKESTCLTLLSGHAHSQAVGS